jgi:tRNA G18 (ribose-2'-O)-methylase SpoU
MPADDRKLDLHELGRASLEHLAQLPRVPIRFVLDDIRSRHNVGSIFRTADAFRLHGLDLCGFTPQPPHREIEKTALGATASVPWRHHATTLQAMKTLHGEGWQVCAVEQTAAAVELAAFVPSSGGRLALVLGNELHGVNAEVIAACDGSIVIPQHGIKHSLNVSVCAGILGWALAGARASVSTGVPRP